MTSTVVGGLPLPAPAGTLNSAINDLPVVALADYLGFWLRNQLNAAVAQIQGLSADICPEENIFPYPPRDNWVLNPTPALYCWWDRDRETTRIPHTMVFDARLRPIVVQWIYDECVSPLPGDDPSQVDARNGFASYVDAVMQLAWSEGRHPDYGYDGAADGTPIAVSMGVLDWTIDRTRPGELVPVPIDKRANGAGADGTISRYYPSVIAQITIKERISRRFEYSQATVLLDSTMVIETNEEPGDPLDPVEFLDMVIEGPPEQP
jgi:hypothetical protein